MGTVICLVCGKKAFQANTKYGIRSSCCGLWSWGEKPLVCAETHAARNAAHKAFDPLWKQWGIARGKAYTILAERLGIPKEECHMALMDKETASKVPKICREIFLETLC